MGITARLDKSPPIHQVMMTDFTPNFDNITAGSPTESARKSIVEVIRQYADHAGISHAEIARRTGMKQPSVNRVLNHRFCPKLDTIITIAHAVGLGITIINPKKGGERKKRF